MYRGRHLTREEKRRDQRRRANVTGIAIALVLVAIGTMAGLAAQ